LVASRVPLTLAASGSKARVETDPGSAPQGESGDGPWLGSTRREWRQTLARIHISPSLVHPVRTRLEGPLPALAPLRRGEAPPTLLRLPEGRLEQRSPRQQEVGPAAADGRRQHLPRGDVEAWPHSEQMPHRPHTEELLLELVARQRAHPVETAKGAARGEGVPAPRGDLTPLVHHVEAVGGVASLLELEES